MDEVDGSKSLKRANQDVDESDPGVALSIDDDSTAKKPRIDQEDATAENGGSEDDVLEQESTTESTTEPKDPQTGLTASQTSALENAKQYAREIQEEVQCALSSAIEPELTLAIANVVEQRKSLCRVYVGSISFEASEDDVRQRLSRFGDIKELVLKVDPATGKHRGFCFVEYQMPEAAILAVEASESLEVGGRHIKIGRPKNYDANAVNDLPPPPEDRIYVANIGSLVSETDLAGIFAAFGEVEKCILKPDPVTRKHKGFGYVQFKTGTNIDTLVESMKGFMLLDLPMGVCKALVGGPLPEGMDALEHMPVVPATSTSAQVRATPAVMPQSSVNPAMIARATATAASTAQRLVAMGQSSGLNGDRESVASEENMSISGNQRYMVMQSLARSGGIVPPAPATETVQTTVVRLQYNATSADIDDQLEEEFREECNARSAAAQLQGRQFDGKTIQASLYDPQEYAAGRLI
ncbi:hypothetical protein BGZ65_004812 [Modicella reniformis]|uniref:RRM domain-containing protein n=1 Tax=Modicella reniformis TaxID=1440133 RepID=A0A9P6MBI4_9FUNG|nr:hypothetical protein BGZ65_004812 [Modicella reniformis]